MKKSEKDTITDMVDRVRTLEALGGLSKEKAREVVQQDADWHKGGTLYRGENENALVAAQEEGLNLDGVHVEQRKHYRTEQAIQQAKDQGYSGLDLAQRMSEICQEHGTPIKYFEVRVPEGFDIREATKNLRGKGGIRPTDLITLIKYDKTNTKVLRITLPGVDDQVLQDAVKPRLERILGKFAVYLDRVDVSRLSYQDIKDQDLYLSAETSEQAEATL